MEIAKVALQSGSVSLTAEGREDFVKEVLGMWATLIAAQGVAAKPTEKSQEATPGDSGGSPSALDATKQYENVFDSVDGKLKIIAHLPGSNKADKARATALTLLFGHYLLGIHQVPSEAIREECTDQGCFDSGNFAKHLKGLGEKVVMNTKTGGGYDVKLTAPGRKAAKELVEGLNG